MAKYIYNHRKLFLFYHLGARISVLIILATTLFLVLSLPTMAYSISREGGGNYPAKPLPVTDRFIIEFKPGQAKLLNSSLQAKKLCFTKNTYSIQLNQGENLDSAIAKYQEVPEVENVLPDYKRYPLTTIVNAKLTDSIAGNWGISRTGVDRLLKYVHANGSAIIAVIDTGVYKDHPLLQGKLMTGYNFIDQNTDTGDIDGHGTHVAGIIAQEIAELPIKIMPVKVMGPDGGYDSDIADGILYAVDHGANVINLSLGGPGESSLLKEAIQTAVKKGVTVVAAAGNGGIDNEDIVPANIPECITVSAVNRQGTIASFSDYGMNIDVAAPGQDIVSSVPPGKDNDGLKDGYISYDGTSMAAPFVSGIAALLRVNDPNLTAAQIESLIDQNVDDAGSPGWDKYYGYGIVNYTRYSPDTVSVSIIDPQSYSDQFGSLIVKCQMSGSFHGQAVISIDGACVKIVEVDGREFSALLNIADYEQATHNLKVDLLMEDGTFISGDQRTFVVRTPNDKLLIRVYNLRGQPAAGVNIEIFSEQDGQPVAGGSTAENGYAQFAFKDSGKFLAIVTGEGNSDLPTYVQEVNNTGLYSFYAHNTVHLAFDKNVTANGSAGKTVALYPIHNNLTIGRISIKIDEKHRELLLDPGDYYLEFSDSINNYCLFKCLHLTQDDLFTFSDQDLISLNVSFDTNLESLAVLPVPRGLTSNKLGSYSLDKRALLKVYPGSYCLDFKLLIKSADADKHEYLFEQVIDLQKSMTIRLGYKLSGSVNLDQTSIALGNQISGSLTIEDEYGNQLLPVKQPIQSLDARDIAQGVDSPVLKILDSYGNVVMTETVDPGRFEFYPSNLAPGNYQLQLDFNPVGLTMQPSTPLSFTVLPGDEGIFPIYPTADSILYSSNQTGMESIYIINSSDGKTLKLKDNPDPNTEPAWSSDGKNIAFIRKEQGRRNLYLLNLNNGREKCLATGQIYYPAWAPNNQTLVFASGSQGVRKIYSYAMANRETELILNLAGDLSEPSFSPEGNALVFLRNNELYRSAADGSNPVQLTDNGLRKTNPHWAEDSRAIYFLQASDLEGFEIEKIDLSDLTQTTLQNSQGLSLSAFDISLNGRIVVVAGKKGVQNIYLLSAGGNLTRLTENSGAQTTYSAVGWVGKFPAPDLARRFSGYLQLNPAQQKISVDHAFKIKLSKPMTADGLNSNNVKLYRSDNGQTVPLAISQSDSAIFKAEPLSLLEAGTEYWLVISPSVTSKSGLILSRGVISKFRTGD